MMSLIKESINVFPEIVVVRRQGHLPYSTNNWFESIYQWCEINQINVRFTNQWESDGEIYTCFEVLDEQQRLWFTMRWE